MEKYVCDLCGYVYDPEIGDPDNGIAPGTKFEDLPADWVCPLCGADKESFSKEQFLKNGFYKPFFMELYEDKRFSINCHIHIHYVSCAQKYKKKYEDHPLFMNLYLFGVSSIKLEFEFSRKSNHFDGRFIQ